MALVSGPRSKTLRVNKMVAAGWDEVFAALLSEATQFGPNFLYDVLRRAISQTVLGNRTGAGLTLVMLQTYAVKLRPWKADGSCRDVAGAEYTCRVLSRLDTDPDFEDGLAKMVATVMQNVPEAQDGHCKWGDPNDQIEGSVAATETELKMACERLLLLASISRKQARTAAWHTYEVDNAALLKEAQAAADEKTKAAKATPTFSVSKIEELVRSVSTLSGFDLSFSDIANQRGVTVFFDALRASSATLPQQSPYKPDELNPFCTVTGDLILYKETTASVRDDDTGAYTTRVDGEVPADGTIRKKGKPRTLMEAYCNERRWWMTVLVAAHALDPPPLGPLPVLNYLDRLLSMVTHPGMWLAQFLVLRDEARVGIIRAFTSGDKPLGEVLADARAILENDLIEFRKSNIDTVNQALSGSLTDAGSSAGSSAMLTKRRSAECEKCPVLRKNIASLEATVKRLRSQEPGAGDFDDAPRGRGKWRNRGRGGRGGPRGGGRGGGHRDLSTGGDPNARRVSIQELVDDKP
jgi:hypothetical protein